MAHELLILFIANAIINQYQPVAILYEQATHGPGTKIVFVGRIEFVPDRFGHYAKHSAAIQLEITGIDSI
jgi:hypothetical protein